MTLDNEKILNNIENSIKISKDFKFNHTTIAIKNLEDIFDLIHHLQAENERLNDLEFTQNHCNLYEENKWLEAEIARQNIEIGRLTEELNDWKQRSDGHQFNADYHLKRNAELQKQVDELTVRTSELFHELQEEKRAYAGAVKDTAKEIFAELFYMASIHHSDVANILAWAKEKAKSKGVEVE